MPRDCPDFRIYHVPSLFLNQHHSLSSNELDTNVIFFPHHLSVRKPRLYRHTQTPAHGWES